MKYIGKMSATQISEVRSRLGDRLSALNALMHHISSLKFTISRNLRQLLPSDFRDAFIYYIPFQLAANGSVGKKQAHTNSNLYTEKVAFAMPSLAPSVIKYLGSMGMYGTNPS